MKKNFPRQSSAADWEAFIELKDDDHAPLWTTVPADLVVSMTVIPEKPSAAETPSIDTNSADGSGVLFPDVNGLVFISAPASTMAGLAPDKYGVDRRFLVLVNIELTDDGTHTHALEGVLTVYKGQ